MYFALGEARRLFDDWVIHNVLATSMFAVVVWLALPGSPENRALWTLTWSSAFGALTAFGAALGLAVTGIAAGDIDAQLVAVAPDELELAGAIGFVFSQALWVPSLFLILTLGLLLFPDGASPSPRWRWVGWFAGLSITALTSYFAWGARPWSDSPYITSNDERLELIPSIVLPMLVVATMASLVGLVVRFRRSTGELRQQFRWVTWGLAILAVATASLIPISIDIFKIVGLPAIALLGISYGVAITKYRLYEIDVVLNRRSSLPSWRRSSPGSTPSSLSAWDRGSVPALRACRCLSRQQRWSRWCSSPYGLESSALPTGSSTAPERRHIRCSPL